jgi:hypothetical protein
MSTIDMPKSSRNANVASPRHKTGMTTTRNNRKQTEESKEDSKSTNKQLH